MAAPSYFDTLDQALLTEATSRFAIPLVLAGGAAGVSLATDPTVPPEVMVAAMVRGHAQGMASALSAVGRVCGNTVSARALQAQILEAAIAEIRADLSRSAGEGGTVQ